jgi:hypothetical protein
MSIYGEDFNDAVKIQFEIINSKSIRVVGGEPLPPLHVVDSVNYVFLFGQEVNNFNNIKKDVIFSVATAALQEIDRQLQAEKEKTTSLESRIAALESRLNT